MKKPRWLIRRDMPAVLEIENSCFEHPWPEEEFIRVMRQRNTIGMVCESNDRVNGFMIYELHSDHLYLLNFAVHPMHHHNGFGTALMDRLKEKVWNSGKRTHIKLTLRESNLPAQLFFNKQGFICDEVIRQPYIDSDEDGYQFIFRSAWEPEPTLSVLPG